MNGFRPPLYIYMKKYGRLRVLSIEPKSIYLPFYDAFLMYIYIYIYIYIVVDTALNFPFSYFFL
jgi:hypothetical protein